MKKKISILYAVRLKPTISMLTAIRSIQRANRRDSDGYRIRKYITEIDPFHNVWKSKISFTEIYEFIWHIHECQFNFVYLYIHCTHREQVVTINPSARNRITLAVCHSLK